MHMRNSPESFLNKRFEVDHFVNMLLCDGIGITNHSTDLLMKMILNSFISRQRVKIE